VSGFNQAAAASGLSTARACLARFCQPARVEAAPKESAFHSFCSTAGPIFVVHDFHHLIRSPLSGSRVVFAARLGFPLGSCCCISVGVPAPWLSSPVEIIQGRIFFSRSVGWIKRL
jgi:hypothetical protein